jgi:lipopolysaccharide/colanic/teichoic acid biosynthesis glycosyltransferase
MKRTLDLVVSVLALIVFSPVLAIASIAVWLQDYHSPFYIPPRAARGGGTFKMVKLRSMRMGADRSGVDSTGANDTRITSIGRLVRAYKLDELTQLWNVMLGDMSLVGPRPNVMREVSLYTAVEKQLLSVRPGITDLSSIVFADEGDILKDEPDPDLAYNQLIRPWKSRLSLFGIQHSSVRLDLEILWLTALTIVSRSRALAGIERILTRLGADEQLIGIARRNAPLYAYPPPGAEAVVISR